MQLFYRKYGSGLPVIILHGLFGMSDNWVTFGKELSEEFMVFIPDQRNHGRSPHSDEFDYYILRDDIIEFINEQNLNEVMMIGHSMGGKVAMQCALKNPGLISKLIVLDISPAGKTAAPEIIQIIKSINTIKPEEMNSREDIKSQLSLIIRQKKIIEFLLKNIIRDENNKFSWKFNVKAITGNLPLIESGLESEARFSKPSLFIGGGKSPYLSGENIYEIFNNFPEATIEVINNAGHWLHVDAPEQLLKMVKAFLRN